MRPVRRLLAGGSLCLAVLTAGLCALAQDEPPADAGQVKQDDLAPPKVEDPGDGFRQNVDGIIYSVSPETQPAESESAHNIIGILNLDEQFGFRFAPGEASPYRHDVLSPALLSAPPASVKALLEADGKPAEGELANSVELIPKNIKLEHAAWGLEFSFKPMRVISVDVPRPARTGQEVVQMFDKNNDKQLDAEESAELSKWIEDNKGKPPGGSGRFDEKLVWYLLFKVTNPGPQPVKFLPRILLHDEETGNWYPDRVIPVAIGPIQAKEDPNRKLLNTVQIAEVEVPPNNEGEIWGVATWEDVDPDMDYFSVYIQGLTNAFQREAVEGPDGKPEWKFSRKTLQLRFWRPGDRYDENDGEFRYGQPGLVPYTWLYK